MKTKVLLSVCCLAGLAVANPTTVRSQDATENTETKLVEAMTELNEKRSIGIFGNAITLEKMDGDIGGRKTDDGNVERDPLMAEIDRFFNGRKLRVALPSDGSAADFFGRALGSKKFEVQLGRLIGGASEARTKLKRVIIPILLALKLKALIVLPIIITIIGMIGIKGLGAGLAALMLSGAVALKALLTPPPPLPARVSYGIVKPQEIHHDHWHRSQEEINHQPYRAWAPEFSPEPYPYDLP